MCIIEDTVERFFRVGKNSCAEKRTSAKLKLRIAFHANVKLVLHRWSASKAHSMVSKESSKEALAAGHTITRAALSLPHTSWLQLIEGLEKSQMRIHYKNVQAGITAMALRLPDLARNEHACQHVPVMTSHLEPLEDQFLDHKRDLGTGKQPVPDVQVAVAAQHSKLQSLQSCAIRRKQPQ